MLLCSALTRSKCWSPGPVVAHRLPLQRLGEGVVVHPAAAQAHRGHGLQQGQRPPGVPVAGVGDPLDLLVVQLDPAAQAPLRLAGAPDEPDRLLRRERLQHQHAAAREQRRVELEGRVLRGRTDEQHVPPLDKRQEGVLLRLVEAVNLVHEEQRAIAGPRAAVPRLSHHRADLLHPGEHGRERHKTRTRSVGHKAREGGLPHARRPPEEQALLDLPVEDTLQELPFAQQVRLSEDLPRPSRPDALGQGRVGGRLRDRVLTITPTRIVIIEEGCGHGDRGPPSAPRGRWYAPPPDGTMTRRREPPARTEKA